MARLNTVVAGDYERHMIIALIGVFAGLFLPSA